MSNIFEIFRRFLNRRKHKRYAVKNGISAIISYDKGGEQTVQLIDIGEGGMSFVYQGSQPDLQTSGVLKLFSTSEIKFETVSDFPVSDPAQATEQFWRRSVKFENCMWMGKIEMADLQGFIAEVKLCEK